MHRSIELNGFLVLRSTDVLGGVFLDVVIVEGGGDDLDGVVGGDDGNEEDEEEDEFIH